MNLKIIFDHIPKTAGTSIHSILREFFLDYLTLASVSNNHSTALKFNRNNSFGGHIFFHEYEKLSSDHLYCTVLRDPITRFISQYNFSRQVATLILSIKDQSNIHWHDPQVSMSLNLTLDEYISTHHESLLLHTYSNVQSKHFAARMSSCTGTMNDKDLLDAAIESLEDYWLVGFTEELPVFIQSLAKTLNVKAPEIKKLNITNASFKTQLPNSKILQRLNQCNKVDTQLLAWAKQRFELSRTQKLKRTAKDWNACKQKIDTDQYGTREITINNIHYYQSKLTQNLLLEFDLISSIQTNNLTIGFQISDENFNTIFGTNTRLLNLDFEIKQYGRYKCRIEMMPICENGYYNLTLAAHQDLIHLNYCYHWINYPNRIPIFKHKNAKIWAPAIQLVEENIAMTSFYKKFEDKYRGSRELIKDRLSVYIPYARAIHQHYPIAKILDLGCGRGEWLTLMKEIGYEASGVDIDEEMLEDCRSLGLNVKFQDALDALQESADSSLLMVTGFHIAEHLPFSKLQDIVTNAFRVLVPGGLLILETPNPENILVSTSRFYLDPTHSKPLPCELLSFIPENAGFYRTQVLRLQEDALLRDGKEATLYNVLTGVSPDYAVVAQKNAPTEITSCLDTLFTAASGLNLETLTNRYETSHQEKIREVNNQLNQALDLLEKESISLQAANTELTNTKIELNTIHQANHHHWTQLQESKTIEDILRNQLTLAQEQSKAELQQAMDTVQASQAQMQWAIEKAEQSEAALENTRHQLALAQEQSKAELQQAMDTVQSSQAQMQWAIEKAEQSEDLAQRQLSETHKLDALLESTRIELQNIHHANHNHWLQLEQSRKELNEVLQANHHHWQLSVQQQQQLNDMLNSWSWRITWPVRMITLFVIHPLNTSRYIANQTVAVLLNAFQKPIAKAIAWVLTKPELAKRINQHLLAWPHLHDHLLVISGQRGLTTPLHEQVTNYPIALNEMQTAKDSEQSNIDLSQLSPRARQIYTDLKATIDQQRKGDH